MDLPHRWHDAEFASCPEVNHGAAVYQSYEYTATNGSQIGGVRNAAFLKMPFMPSPPHMRFRNADSDYPQSSHIATHQGYSSDMMVYSRSPSLVSENNEMEFTSITPTSVPSTIQMAHQSSACKSTKPVKLCPLLTGESDLCRPEKCGSMAPCLEFGDLPPIEECVTMPYITPPVQDEQDMNDPFFLALRQQPRQQQQANRVQQKRKASVITPPGSRRSSAGSSQSSSVADQSAVRTTLTSSSPTPKTLSNNLGSTKSKHATNTKMSGSKNGMNPGTTATASIKASKTTGHSDKDSKLNASKLRARQAHSLVERRYRENLNLRISQLHESLQSTKFGPTVPRQPHQHQLGPYQHDSATPSNQMLANIFDHSAPSAQSASPLSSGPSNGPDKIRKSDILSSAMVYIDHAETEMRRMNHEILRLHARINVLEHGGGSVGGRR